MTYSCPWLPPLRRDFDTDEQFKQAMAFYLSLVIQMKRPEVMAEESNPLQELTRGGETDAEVR